VRANPVLRSYPAFSLANVRDGVAAGGDFFLSYNVTASMPVWVKPLVPSDISEDAFIRQSIDGMMTSSESTLTTSYKIADAAHQRAVAASRPLKSILEAIRHRVSQLLPTLSEDLKSRAQSCEDQIETLADAVDAVSPKTFVGGLLKEPVDEGDATLPSVIRACVDSLGAGDAVLGEKGRELVATRTAIDHEIQQIDVRSAERLARTDMRFARETVGTVMDEMNAVAVGPTLVFDVSKLGQHQSPRSAITRYGVGTGVRLSIASTFHLSAGYVWNVHRPQGERPGAAFVAIELTSLLGR
jgi:hypothetical protein